MNTRKVLLGCSITVLVLIGIAAISGVVLYQSLSGRAALPPVTLFVDEGAVGMATARLAPDDVWVADLVTHIATPSARSVDPNAVFPAEAVWTARQLPAGGEEHTIALSLSPKGRLLGMLADVGLWKAGRAPDGHVERVEFEGEGITSFPGTGIPGQVFVRDNTFVWASDLDAARHAVTLMNAPREGPPPESPLLAALQDPAGHALYGAILNRSGSLARILALVPGEALDIPEARLAAVTAMSCVFDADSAKTGLGRIVIDFTQDATEESVGEVTREMADRLTALRLGGVTLHATGTQEPSRGVITVEAAGLDSLVEWLAARATRVQEEIDTGAPPSAR